VLGDWLHGSRLTLESDVLYASVSAAKAALCAVPVELKPLASIAFLLAMVSTDKTFYSRVLNVAYNVSMLSYRSVALSNDLHVDKESISNPYIHNRELDVCRLAQSCLQFLPLCAHDDVEAQSSYRAYEGQLNKETGV
jgi:hypothetical protein